MSHRIDLDATANIIIGFGLGIFFASFVMRNYQQPINNLISGTEIMTICCVSILIPILFMK